MTDSGNKLSNYSVTTNAGTLTVNRAALMVTADNQTRVFSAANPSLTFTITGFVNSDTAATATTGVPSLTTTATTASAVGTYAITPTVGSLAAANYSFGFANGTLEITPAATVTALASSQNPSIFGSNVTFTAVLAPVSPATATPVGNVQFFANNVALGSPVAPTGDTATFSTASLPSGTNLVTAVYLGSSNFQLSSNSVSQVVSPAAAVPTTLGLTVNGDGTVSVNFQGTPGASYLVFANSDLSNPDWSNVSTNIAGTNGCWTFKEAIGNHPQRFYRAAKP